MKLDTDFCNKCGLDGGLCDGCFKKEIYLKGRIDGIDEFINKSNGAILQDYYDFENGEYGISDVAKTLRRLSKELKENKNE